MTHSRVHIDVKIVTADHIIIFLYYYNKNWTNSTDSQDCLPILLSKSVFPPFSFWFRAFERTLKYR